MSRVNGFQVNATVVNGTGTEGFLYGELYQAMGAFAFASDATLEVVVSLSATADVTQVTDGSLQVDAQSTSSLDGQLITAATEPIAAGDLAANLDTAQSTISSGSTVDAELTQVAGSAAGLIELSMDIESALSAGGFDVTHALDGSLQVGADLLAAVADQMLLGAGISIVDSYAIATLDGSTLTIFVKEPVRPHGTGSQLDPHLPGAGLAQHPAGAALARHGSGAIFTQHAGGGAIVRH